MSVIWRFTGRRLLSEHAEERAQRLVAVSFSLLAPYVAQDAIRTLIAGGHPSVSAVGIGLSISSLVLMPLLGRAKHHIGSKLGPAATAGEGEQNMLCAYLAVGVLAGLALNAAFGVWWADPIVALAIAVLAVKEGRETWCGEGCCAPSMNAGGVLPCEDEGAQDERPRSGADVSCLGDESRPPRSLQADQPSGWPKVRCTVAPAN